MFDTNRSQLLSNGIKLYPGKNHSEFYRAFTDTPEQFHRYYRSWNKNPNQNTLRSRQKEYFLSNRHSNHLVTGEDISLLSTSALSELKLFLHKDCGITKITIVCFLREPLEYLNSSLQQFIKPGLVTLKEITDDTLHSYRLQGVPDFSGGIQNILSQIYFPIPEKLIQVFGLENIHFVKFETAIKIGLARSVLGYFGNCRNLLTDDTRTSNSSISHESCLLLSEYNNRNPLLFENMSINRKRINDWTTVVIRSIPGTPPQLLNPSRLDLKAINGSITRINSLVGFEIMTPVDFFPKYYTENNFYRFSPESVDYLESKIDKSYLNHFRDGNTITTNHLTEINRKLNVRHRTQLRSRLYNLGRLVCS